MADMACRVRTMEHADRTVWTNMRSALWPEETAQAHADMIDTLLGGDDGWGFIAETADAVPAGFAEVTIRKFANGCETQPVPFLEGIWVTPEFRRLGVGARLVGHIEMFMVQKGFQEIGSDTQIDNLESQAAHIGWGFSETERVVYYRKDLQSRDTQSRHTRSVP
jgi:aminoglycoside 6'-N-acetyltransferase I